MRLRKCYVNGKLQYGNSNFGSNVTSQLGSETCQCMSLEPKELMQKIVDVKCIVVDGANRKWIGTSSNGLYLVSPDGSEILQHFTTDNSPLVSNEIYTLAIEGTKGEIMIGTSEGLCSYISDYSDPFDTFEKDNIKIYPNPVTPDFTGTIQITGFELDSYVKIASANGRLVKEGRSVGGKFTWDGRLNDGRPAESGVYFILASNGEGSEHVASKFLIVR